MKRMLAYNLGAMAIGALLTGPAQAGDLRQDANAIFKTVHSVPPTLKDNAVSPEKVELGKKLFFDPRLSKSGILSCNSCHDLGTGGVDAGPTSIGHAWQKGPRRAPSVLNAVYNIAQFWDGRAEDLKAQAKGPVQAAGEMANTPALLVSTLKSIPEYSAEFTRVFPSDKDPVSFDNFAKAVEAFESTLTTPNSRFDQFLDGNEAALNLTEKQGLRLFIDKGCANCHSGVNLGGNSFHPFGVAQKPSPAILPVEDKGRANQTKAEADQYVFRTAPLRNVALRAPYFHSAQVWTLEEAVSVMGQTQLGTQLSEDEVKAITAFLGTLTGDQPQVTFPVLPPRTKDTPKPQP